jgi:hypothetical protein
LLHLFAVLTCSFVVQFRNQAPVRRAALDCLKDDEGLAEDREGAADTMSSGSESC